MRSAFGAWLIRQRIARVALTAALLPLFGLFSAAIVVCTAAVKGWREAGIDCAIALSLLLAITGFSGEPPQSLLFSAASTWGLALLMGGLAGQYGSLTLPIQALIMVSSLALTLFSAAVSDVQAFWAPILTGMADQLQQVGIELTDVDAIVAMAPIMSGLFAAGTVASSIAALMLGCWWAGGAKGQPFGDLFINLRLGYVIGILAALAGLGALLNLQPLSGNLLLIAGTGFWFQGLAVVHWHVVKRQLPRVLLILVYLPLFMGASLVVMALFLFAAVGFIDNWYGLRRANTD
ncbi:MAG: hypothetical protein OEU86_05915 [Gammaproteobacteria bacterium]|nr:hypothetical protein [Gammaproteobacteria bacterium]